MSEEKKYYVMAAENPNRMLLYSMPGLPDDIEDDWMFGKRFSEEPEQPIRVEIQPGFEKKELLPFFDNPPIVSEEFLQTLFDAGVDNLVAYDVEIHSEDNSVIYTGYKAINIIGVIKAAGLGTVFAGDSELIDASIDRLEIDPQSPHGALLFRLAENVSAIIVHDKVKKLIESRKFSSVVFREPNDYLAP